jgi:hypothetical protein
MPSVRQRPKPELLERLVLPEAAAAIRKGRRIYPAVVGSCYPG